MFNLLTLKLIDCVDLDVLVEGFGGERFLEFSHLVVVGSDDADVVRRIAVALLAQHAAHCAHDAHLERVDGATLVRLFVDAVLARCRAQHDGRRVDQHHGAGQYLLQLDRLDFVLIVGVELELSVGHLLAHALELVVVRELICQPHYVTVTKNENR